MFNNDYKEIKDQKGYIIYKTKVFINDFSYSFLDHTNTKIQSYKSVLSCIIQNLHKINY